MNRLGFLWLFFLILPVVTGNLHAEEETDTTYRLVHTDSVNVVKVAEEYITTLIGHVHFFYGSTEFRADQAQFHDQKRYTILEGRVFVRDDTLTLSADRAEYFRVRQTLDLQGDVIARLYRDSLLIRTFQSDRIVYNRNTGGIEATGNVLAHDLADSLQGGGGYGKYNLETGYGYMIRNPWAASLKADSLRILAGKMEFFNDFSKVAASFDVRTHARDLTVRSDFLLYFIDTKEAVYLGRPSFSSDTADGKAGEFRLHFDETSLRRIVMTDSCRVDFVSEEGATEKVNRVEGDRMEFFLEDGHLSRCIAESAVASDVSSRPASWREWFGNKAGGGHLDIRLDEEGRIQTIIMSDGVVGKYRFLKEEK